MLAIRLIRDKYDAQRYSTIFRRISLRVICFICIWICLSVNILSPLLDCAGARKQIFESISPASEPHRGEKTNIWKYKQALLLNPTGARKQILEWIVPASKFRRGQEANIYISSPQLKISNVYSSEVLPTKTPQSLFRLFVTNLHKRTRVKVAQHRRLPWHEFLCRFYILSGIRINNFNHILLLYCKYKK